MIGIYQICNIKNGKRYIGSSVNVDIRLYEHKRVLELGQHHNVYLQRAWDKYGPDAFELSKLLVCILEDVLLYEQWFLDRRKPEYNLSPTAGSPLGYRHTDEAKALISEANKGNTYGLGYRHTKEAKGKMKKNTNASPLTKLDVYEIRRLYTTGKVTQAVLGKMFRIGQSGVSKIVIHQTWKCY